jgi:hypothetical protein
MIVTVNVKYFKIIANKQILSMEDTLGTPMTCIIS